MKIQTKTTLLILFTFITIILLFSGFIYFSLSDYSYDDFYRLLEIRAVTAAKVELDSNTSTDLNEIEKLRDQFFEKLPHEKDYFFPVNEDKNFEKAANTLDVPLSFFDKIIRDGGAEYENSQLFFKGIIYESTQGPYVVVASAENYYESHHSAYLKRMLTVAISASFIFLLFISFYISKYIFNPLTKITEKVKDISSESLQLRLDLSESKDELHELSRTFNDMLDRIETSFESQNNFISNASHELRTPLTSIMGEADVTLTKYRKPEEYIEALKVILDEAEKLESKTQALLFLAQTGFHQKKQSFSETRMDEVLWDVKKTVEKLYPKSKIIIDTSLLPENPLKLRVCGNEQLLHLALSNIIGNACKYSDFREVHISLGASNTHVFLVVKDSGIGIPKEEIKYIYDPFFRASNTKKYEGYGIGLPLTRNIIKMHSGEILVNSVINKGTTVQIKIPTTI